MDRKKLVWTNLVFFCGTGVTTLVLVPLYFYFHSVSIAVLIFSLIFWACTMLSITAGYHRLFAHRGYKAKQWVEYFFLIFGSAAFQGSILKWATDHRRHHLKVDTDSDPYNINQGFFYAHMGWLFFEDDQRYSDKKEVDLLDDPKIVFQDKYYNLIATFMSFIFPTIVGAAMGDIWGGLIIGGLLRLFVIHHSTFFINSLCHTIGHQPYSDKYSAKDSVIMAFLTHGEGYHNYHHKFQFDYRNGIKWYHWDPSKWFIGTLSFVGQTYQLKKASSLQILRSKMEMQEKRLKAADKYAKHLEELKIKIENAGLRFQEMKREYMLKKKNFTDKSHHQIQQLKVELQIAKLEFNSLLRMWYIYVRAKA